MGCINLMCLKRAKWQTDDGHITGQKAYTRSKGCANAEAERQTQLSE